MSEAIDGSVQKQPIPSRVDKEEFVEAFTVFSKGRGHISTNELGVFLKSLGLGCFKSEIEEKIKTRFSAQPELMDLDNLESVVLEVTSAYSSKQDLYWPSDSDVLAAFEVIDQEGLGYIPVQQLKRFLLQAQLGFRDEKELEQLIRENCRIDGDDQINYEDFVQKIRTKFSKSCPQPGADEAASGQ